MQRCLPLLFAATLLLPGGGAAEDRGPPAAADNPGSLGLDTLADTPLPGESGPPERAADASLGGFAGRPVSRVSAVDPPPGFNPVEDADIRIGARLDAALVRRAVLRLWESGSYRDVRISARGAPDGSAELLIRVAPIFRVKKLAVTGNKALDGDAVARAIDYAPDRTIVPDPDALRALRTALQRAYADRGFPEARAELRIETTDQPGGVVLAVDIEEGKPDRYTRIEMPGLPGDLSADGLARKIGLRRNTVRDRERVEKGLRDLAAELARSGYPDARTPGFEERRTGPRAIALVIPVDAGLKTEIAFRGNRHFTSRRLLEAIGAEGQMRSSAESAAEALGRLEAYYRRYGFLHVRAEAMRVCADAKGQASVPPLLRPCGPAAVRQKLAFAIDEGPPVEVAEVIFHGNRFFSNRFLEQELFAFMKEKEAEKETDLFQPLTTATIDDLGLSDKRPPSAEGHRGAQAPRLGRGRNYLPERYAEAVDHLVGIYQEKGFLDAAATDRCALSALSPITVKGMRFEPFALPGAAGQGTPTGSAPADAGDRCLLINRDRDHLVAILAIDEGVQTLVSDIGFEGNAIFPGQDLEAMMKLRRGDPYNAYRLQQSAREIRNRYRGLGYMFAEVSWDPSFSDDKQRVQIAFKVAEGPLVRVGRIRIDGAETTAERLLRERLVLGPGDVVTPEKIEESQQRLTELGVLRGAVVQMVSPEMPAPVKNLKVQVTESKAQYLELKAGLATVEGLRGGFEYGYRNLFGWALNARLRVRANYRLVIIGNPAFAAYYDSLSLFDKIERHLLLGVGQQHFPGSRGMLGWDLEAIFERLNEPPFSADRTPIFLRLKTIQNAGKQHRNAIMAELRNGVEINRIDVLALQSIGDQGALLTNTENPFYQRYLRMPEGTSEFWVTGVGITLDFRDSPFNPKKGVFASLSGDYVRSLDDAAKYKDPSGRFIRPGDPEFAALRDAGQLTEINRLSNLIRAQATLSGYIPFGQSDFVLALSVSFGYIFHLEKRSTTWADRYFYAGGVETLRGFPEASLVPEDIYQYWKSHLADASDAGNALVRSTGGQAMLMLRGELRIPLPKRFYGTVFAEAGNLWRDPEKIAPLTLSPLALHLRPVAGLGFRYVTPIGPLSFDVGINCDRRPHEEPFAWYFSIGSAF